MDQSPMPPLCASFRTAPAAGLLYLSEPHRRVLEGILAGLDQGGILTLTGEAGTGKTTLGHEIAHRCADRAPLWLGQTRAQLLDLPQHLDALDTGPPGLLIVDEAQALPDAGLDYLSALRAPPAMLLIGPQELDTRLAGHRHGALRARITGRFQLHPFEAGETAAYIAHRFRVADCACHAGLQVFDADGAAQIHALSGGLPRVINHLVQACLFEARTRPDARMEGAFVRACLDGMAADGRLASLLPVPTPGREPAAAPPPEVSPPVPAPATAPRPPVVTPPPEMAPHALALTAAPRPGPPPPVVTPPVEVAPPVSAPVTRPAPPLPAAVTATASPAPIAAAAPRAATAQPVAMTAPAIPVPDPLPLVPATAATAPSAPPAPAARAPRRHLRLAAMAAVLVAGVIAVPQIQQRLAAPAPVARIELGPAPVMAAPDPGALLDQALATGEADAAHLYTRAALWGSQRAAYYLGQLYETGIGTTRDPDRAAGWYAAAPDIAGAGARLAVLDAGRNTAPRAPAAGPVPVAHLLFDSGQTELHWQALAGTARFRVEFVAAGETAIRQLDTARNATLIPLPVARWRVMALGPGETAGPASDWLHLTPEGLQ